MKVIEENMNEYLYLELDIDGTILDFECTFIGTQVEKANFIRKNWFDIFIKVPDRKKQEKSFKEIFEGTLNRIFEQKNDIKWFDGTHKYMNFYNELQIENGRKVLKSKAYEIFEDNDRDLNRIKKQPLP